MNRAFKTSAFLALLFCGYAACSIAYVAQDANKSQAKPPDLTKTAINRKDYANLLNDLQGNILQDHGREHAVLLFVSFHGNSQAVKKWIREFASAYVTSAAKQHDRKKMFGGIYLSASAYETLALPEEQHPSDEWFAFGMKDGENMKRLGDPAIKKWEKPYQHAIDALIVLADNNRQVLTDQTQKVKDSIENVVKVVATESISRLRNRAGHEIEHFGYADSVSQPLFFEKDLQNVQRKMYDPSAPLKLVLVRDPNGSYSSSCGSYLVVRKLHQDVSKFNAELAKLAKQLKIDTELAGAYVVGRFKDGTPVSNHFKPQGKNVVPNDFDFDQDPDGRKCPFHAHIRRVNPRGSTQDSDERDHRIVRRSMMFGVQDNGKTQADGNVGMMFMCFQSNIGNQFAFMQEKWANTPSFPKSGTGRDPLIGQESTGESVSGQPQQARDGEKTNYPRNWSKKGTQTFTFRQCVTMKGGEYFFAPSISFLKNIR